MSSIPPPRPGLRTGANMSDGDTSIFDEIDPRAMVPPAEDGPFAVAMADVPDDDSLAMVQAMTLGEPIGNGALRELLAWGQVNRYARVRDSLIAAGIVKRILGGHGGRLVLLIDDPAELATRGELGVGRERSLYRAIGMQVRDLLLFDVLQVELDDDERVLTYRTADQGSRSTRGKFTRADLTSIVTSSYPSLGIWRDVHTFEIKAYWDLGRDSLYEAAAQAALQQCTHSWLIVYAPDKGTSLLPAERAKVEACLQLLPELRAEAAKMGLGLAICHSLATGARLTVDGEGSPGVHPRRQIVDPSRLSELLVSLEDL